MSLEKLLGHISQHSWTPSMFPVMPSSKNFHSHNRCGFLIFFLLLSTEGNADAIINGMLEEMALAFDSQMAPELQGHLFAGERPFGLDLLAVDIQRGRDHGMSV